MAQHDVEFTVPRRPVGNADIEFTVYRDGTRFGELHISKGAVVWVERNRQYGRRLDWQKFASIMQEQGTEVRP